MTFCLTFLIEGEKSGKKKSPEEVHQLLRKHLSTDEYVTPQQIRSLYSRWSKQYREGTLIKPTATSPAANDDQEIDDIDDDCAKLYQSDLHDLASEVVNPWQVDDWLAVSFKGVMYPRCCI